MIPDLSNPQSWNRYSYVLNTPINASDPTGHKCSGEIDECLDDDGNPINGVGIPDDSDKGRRGDDDIDTNGNGVPDVPDPTFEIQYPNHICKFDNLVECTYARGYWPSGDYTFSDEEWRQFTIAIFLDIVRRSPSFWTLEFNADNREWPFVPFHTEEYYAREGYDTIFWNGDTTGTNPLTGNVCFENGNCYQRNDVNYVAQGMWSAANYEGHWGAEKAANYWKQKEYGHGASAEVLYWVNVGVDLYNQYAHYGWR